MRNQLLAISSLCLTLAFQITAFANLNVDHFNADHIRSTWVYDGVYDKNGKRSGTQPGLFAEPIVSYNKTAKSDHAFTQVINWGGSLKMRCDDVSTPCDETTLSVTYNQASTDAYYDAAKTLSIPFKVLPTVGGAIGDDTLKNFNNMNKKTAKLFADIVARTYCADARIDGIQFDLEPFDMTQRGQIAFYRQIAKDLAGRHDEPSTDSLKCADDTHPNGRFFAIFTTSGKIDSTVSEILNEYHNGFIVGALYTLIKATGKANPPFEYKKIITNEVNNMVQKANQYDIRFRLAIPFSATKEEFETLDDTPSGYKQLDYVKIAIKVINRYAKSDPHFVGIDAWGFSSRRIKQNKEYKPSTPPQNVLNYLANHL